MAEEFNIREINFPIIPDGESEELKDYLRKLERVLQESLKGSIYIEKVLEDGIIGN